jgi:hypothetical protein
MEIGLRAYNKRITELVKYPNNTEQEMPDFTEIFCWDVETTVDEKQLTRFGIFIRKNIKIDLITKMGIFYDRRNITEQELGVIKSYCKKNPLIKLYTVDQFINEIFYPTAYLEHIPVINYNTSFDVSRVSKKFGYAKKRFKNGFRFTLSDKWPAIKIKHISSTESLIEFGSSSYSNFKGFFVDCSTISAIMLGGRPVSLMRASKEYNKKYFKIDVEEHGKDLDEAYIFYCENDVLCTMELFTHLKNEYDRFNVDLPLTKVFSAASIAKSVLAKLGVTPMNLSDVPPELIGKICQTYIGGLCQVGVRKQEVLVDALDFTACYPTANLVLGLENFLKAERIDYFDDTQSVIELLNSINSIDDLKNQEIWGKLIAICEVIPDQDLLPTRARYNSDNFSVGLNFITSSKPIYYCLPSVVLSKLKTGKTPNIKSAIRFVPVGRQKTLKKAIILDTEIRPTDNIFKKLVEERLKSKKAKDGRDKLLKVICNVLSYGIYFEVNKENEASEIQVYSGNESFYDFRRFEREGKFYQPVVAALVTDTTKAFLQIGEIIAQQNNRVVAYEDTDSLYISKTDPSDPISSKIISYFDFINPYDKNLLEHLLKVEEANVNLYAISAKRYCLYKFDEKGNFVIRDDWFSLHGMGHLLSPFGQKIKSWEREVWTDILQLHYNRITLDQFLSRYRNYYAVSQFTISTEALMNRFSILNEGKSDNEIIRPFSFFLIGFSNDKSIKPIATFSKDPQSMPYGEFIDYKSGKKMSGQQFFKTLDAELFDYVNHPESKLEGDIGILKRRHIVVNKISFLGKESDRIEQHLGGLGNVDYNIYNNPKDVEQIISKTWNEVKKCGIPQSQFYALKKQLKEGKRLKLSGKTMMRLRSLNL